MLSSKKEKAADALASTAPSGQSFLAGSCGKSTSSSTGGAR